MAAGKHLIIGSICGLFAIWTSLAAPESPMGVNCARGEDAKNEAKNDADIEQPKAQAVAADVTQGALRIVGEDATVVECPLEHTAVEASISGFISRVKVTQTFRNPTKEKIEAVYVFPLPHEAAVDDMTMVIGKRRIVGLIKRRADARSIYEQALASGQTAALLEQERTNIFTQSVGNIEPGQKVDIEISYVDVLKYDMGTYEFHFPMVVGPRYNPHSSPGQPDVVDAGKINPPVLKPDQRTGHDVSLSVNLDAGVPIQDLSNSNHQVHTIRKDDRTARVRLLQEDSIPNKDFVLRYAVVGEKPEMAVLSHTGQYSGDARQMGEGYFMLMIQPKEDERLKKSPPREIVFLVDVSGSMRGEPTAKVRDAMKQMLNLCREKDTFQVVTFASNANKLFEAPVPVNDGNRTRALDFTSAIRGGGGTRMLEGVKMAIDQPIDEKRIRIVVMLTDGYIGNEAQIIQHVGENCGDQIRFWCLGIGQSPNMMLIDGVARHGGGMGKKLGLNDDTEGLTTEVMTRIQRAQLAKLNIDWGNLQVSETFPAKLPELWAGRPVIVYGRYKDGGQSEITVSGNVEGEAVSWPLSVTLPKSREENDVLAKVWARQKIEDLMHQTYYQGSPAVEEEVTAMALQYRLMSQYTSFVAVDPATAGKIEEPARPPRRMMVPVPLPEGTQWEGFFGERDHDGIVGRGRGGFGGGGGGDDAFGIRLGEETARKGSEMKRIKHWIGGVERLSRRTRGAAAPQMQRLAQQQAQLGQQFSGQHFGRPSRQYTLTRGITTRGGGRAYQPARPATAGAKLKVNFAADIFDAVESSESLEGKSGVLSALMAEGDKYRKAAEAALKDARQLEKDGKLDQSRFALARAYLLDVAATTARQSDGDIAGQAMEALENLHSAYIKTAVKEAPSLGKRLDLVIRDRSLDNALQMVAKAAGIIVKLTDGSIADAESLTLQSTHISYLDLRRATVVQALDWITQPARLQWKLAEGSVLVSSARREDGSSAWIYDVSTIAFPLADEFKNIKEPAKKSEAAQLQTKQLLAAIRTSAGLDDKPAIWFAPGQLLVFASKDAHAKLGDLLFNLADPKFKPSKELAEIHKLTTSRAKERREAVAKLQKRRHQLDVAVVHDQFGWQMLAAASAGKSDLEALTKLQIAWRDKATQEMLAGTQRGVALRSLWMVCESAKAVPEDQELAALADAARRLSHAAADKAVADLQAKPKDPSAFAAVLYAALAAQATDNLEYPSKALPVLEEIDDPTLKAVANALLGGKSTDQTDELLAKPVSGDDLVVLTALACRRVGGSAWTRFRARSRQMLGSQPLRGETIVIVNRLSTSSLPTAVTDAAN